MAFIRNSFSVLALIFTVAVPYHARDSHYTIVQLANSQTRILANLHTRKLAAPPPPHNFTHTNSTVRSVIQKQKWWLHTQTCIAFKSRCTFICKQTNKTVYCKSWIISTEINPLKLCVKFMNKNRLMVQIIYIFMSDTRYFELFVTLTWTASSEFGTYSLCEQRRFRRACASAQSRHNLRCSLIQAVSQEEPSDRKPDP